MASAHRSLALLERLGAQAPGREVWSSFVLRENLSQPMAPLSAALWRDTFLPIVLETLTGLPPQATRERRLLPVDRIAGRLCWNVNRLMATPAGALLAQMVALLDDGAGRELHAVLDEILIEPPPILGLRKLWALGHSLVGLWRHLRRMAGGLGPGTERYYLRHAVRERRLAQEPLGTLDDQALSARLAAAVERSQQVLRDGLAHEFMGIVGMHVGRWLWPYISARSYAAYLCDVPAGPAGALAAALQRLAALGLAYNDVFASDELVAIDQRLQAVPDHGAMRALWQAVLQRSGHRSPHELDLAAPRFAEEPALLARALRAGLAPTRPFDDTGAGYDEPHVLDHVQRWPVVGRLLQPLFALFGRFPRLRELPGWSFAMGLWHLRRGYQEVGRRLQARGVLLAVDDIWLLEPEEARDLLLGLRHSVPAARKLVEGRRAQQQEAWSCEPPTTLRSDGEEVPLLLEAEQPGPLHGVPASPGRTTGVVHIVDDPRRATVLPGAVLVAAGVTPGWAPLFVHAAAVITEVGDIACHAATMARELGVPAVVGVYAARQRLRAGEPVVVDGDAGTVALAR